MRWLWAKSWLWKATTLRQATNRASSSLSAALELLRLLSELDTADLSADDRCCVGSVAVTTPLGGTKRRLEQWVGAFACGAWC